MHDLGLQGWSADPFRLHEQRYFSSGRPTKLVRDGERESYDDPPEYSYEPATTVLPEIPPELDFPVAVYTDARDSAQHWLMKSRSYLAVAGSVLAATALAVGVIVATGPAASTPPPPPAVPPATFVTQSAERTLAQRTADISVTGIVPMAGHSVVAYGTGEADFGTNAMSLDVHLNVAGTAMEERVILVNGNSYVAIGQDGSRPRWTRQAAPQSDSADLISGDPPAALVALEQQGNGVRALGTRIVGGVTCFGYAATPSGPSALTQGFTVTIWIDQRGLVREISMTVPTTATGGQPAGTGSLAADFSNFGAPVRITPPPTADIVSGA